MKKKGSALNTFKIVTHRRKEKILNSLFWKNELFKQNKSQDPIVYTV